MPPWLDGVKTYLIGWGGILSAWGAVLNGAMSIDEAVQVTWAALLAMGIRRGMKTGK